MRQEFTAQNVRHNDPQPVHFTVPPPPPVPPPALGVMMRER